MIRLDPSPYLVILLPFHTHSPTLSRGMRYGSLIISLKGIHPRIPSLSRFQLYFSNFETRLNIEIVPSLFSNLSAQFRRSPLRLLWTRPIMSTSPFLLSNVSGLKFFVIYNLNYSLYMCSTWSPLELNCDRNLIQLMVCVLNYYKFAIDYDWSTFCIICIIHIFIWHVEQITDF